MEAFWRETAAYFRNLGSELWRQDFYRGALCALATYFIVLMLVHLLFLICRRRKKCSELFIPGPNGNIVVSIRAVSAATRAALREFDQLTVEKIVVYRHKEGYVFDVRGGFRVGGAAAPELYSRVTEQIKAAMSATFGIANIVRVDLHIDDCVPGAAGKPTPPEADELPDADM